MDGLQDRTYIEVDLSAVRHNLGVVREKVGRDVKIMCMIKANAYGHGAVAVAGCCEDTVDYFGVATVDEGIELRQSGISLPILIVGDIAKSRYQDAIDCGLQMTVHSLESARSLDLFCKSALRSADVHIAVDTGMGRIGFLPSEVAAVLEVGRLENLNVMGIFTHFAKADEPDKSYTDRQRSIFDGFVASLQAQGMDVGLRHASNSAGILDMPSCNYDMVRAGIMAYGLYPSDSVARASLRAAMSLYSHIVHIKTAAKGSCISYGGDYVAREDTTVATVCVGYGDGYPRALSDKARVIVRGKSAPVIGRICMDQMMIDVTHIDGAAVGDIVTLIGQDGSLVISAEELANLSGTVNYELVCSFAQRVPRICV